MVADNGSCYHPPSGWALPGRWGLVLLLGGGIFVATVSGQEATSTAKTQPTPRGIRGPSLYGLPSLNATQSAPQDRTPEKAASLLPRLEPAGDALPSFALTPAAEPSLVEASSAELPSLSEKSFSSQAGTASPIFTAIPETAKDKPETAAASQELPSLNAAGANASSPRAPMGDSQWTEAPREAAPAAGDLVFEALSRASGDPNTSASASSLPTPSQPLPERSPHHDSQPESQPEGQPEPNALSDSAFDSMTAQGVQAPLPLTEKPNGDASGFNESVESVGTNGATALETPARSGNPAPSQIEQAAWPESEAGSGLDTLEFQPIPPAQSPALPKPFPHPTPAPPSAKRLTSRDFGIEDTELQLRTSQLPRADESRTTDRSHESTQRNSWRASNQLSADISLHGPLPTEIAEPSGQRLGMQAGPRFPMTPLLWTAPGSLHQPLYFEDVNLERAGHSWGVLQPAVSAAHFFGRIPALPYLMIAYPPNECVYALGHYRPGSCSPRLRRSPRIVGRQWLESSKHVGECSTCGHCQSTDQSCSCEAE